MGRNVQRDLQRSSTEDALYPAGGRGLDVTLTVLR